jgi:hypothetical protein
LIDETAECQRILQTLRALGTLLSVKLYRLTIEPPPAAPILPCLDHEAMLHETVDPHAAVYVQDQAGNLHELVFVPARRLIVVDTASTLGECSPDAQARFLPPPSVPGLSHPGATTLVVAGRAAGRRRLPRAGDAARRAPRRRH